ncbi:hypothetical protein [Weissella oryzae]|uniref:hypothetical protein n=1 Tax=Weissella oryzae TaxID=1129792 RepID=UPI00168122BE|nr:hypothetical protein [Weissella oryzae]
MGSKADVINNNTQDAIGTPSDAHQPSDDGFWFILTLKSGFIIQPQSEQNIVAGDKPKIDANFANQSLNPGVSVKIIKWRWDTNNSKWVNEGSTDYSTSSQLITGRTGISTDKIDSIQNPGTYYYQIAVLNGFWPIRKTYYSQLAKVNVSSVPVPSYRLSIDAPNIVFAGQINGKDADIGYDAKGILTPNNSTDSIKWVDSNDVKFSPSEGINTKFSVPSSLNNKINSSTEKSGIPVQLNATAGNSNATKEVLVGGLAAKSIVKNTSFNWSIDGLSDFKKIAGDNVTSWNYQWNFFDANGNKITDTDGIKNVSGTVQNLEDLNNTKVLTVSSGKFMDAAYVASESNKPYSAQMILTFNISGQSVTVKTNKANLFVTAPNKSVKLQMEDTIFNRTYVNSHDASNTVIDNVISGDSIEYITKVNNTEVNSRLINGKYVFNIPSKTKLSSISLDGNTLNLGTDYTVQDHGAYQSITITHLNIDGGSSITLDAKATLSAADNADSFTMTPEIKGNNIDGSTYQLMGTALKINYSKNLLALSPTNIDFGGHRFVNHDQIINREATTNAPNSVLNITDARRNHLPVKLFVNQNGPFKLLSDLNVVLPSQLRLYQNNSFVTLDNNPVEIAETKSGDQVKSVIWTKDEGLKLYSNGTNFMPGDYQTTLTWTATVDGY